MTSLQCFALVLCSHENISLCFASLETYTGGLLGCDALSGGALLLSAVSGTVDASVAPAEPWPPPPPVSFSPFFSRLTTLFWRFGRVLPFFCPPCPPAPFRRFGRLLLLGEVDVAGVVSAVPGRDGGSEALDGGLSSIAVVISGKGTGGYRRSQCRLRSVRWDVMQAMHRLTTAWRCRVPQLTRCA